MKVNVYDFDGTIYYGDCSMDFVKYCYNKKIIGKRYVFKVCYNFLRYAFGIIDKTEAKEVVFSFLGSIDDLDSLVEEFWQKHRCKIKPFYLKKKHNRDIISSASPYFLLRGICSELGVMDLFASNVDKCSGKFNGANNENSEKVRALFEKYPDVVVNEMYSDSINDKPLLDIAKKSFMVKDDLIYDYKDYKKSFVRVLWDFYRDHLEVINYLIIGGCTTVVSILSYVLASRLFDLGVVGSNIFSWIIAVVFAYFSNKWIVFKSKNNRYLLEFIKFSGSRVITLFLETLLMILFVSTFKWNDIVSKIIVQFVVIVGNYILSKLFIFKKDC